MRPFASIAAAAFGAAFLPAAAFAQAATPAPTATAQAGTPGQAAGAPVVGATVYDAQGMEVGRVESVAGGSAIVFTGTNRAAVPLASFGASPKGPTLGMTRAELDQAAAKAAAAATDQLRARLTPGTDVRGKAGAVIAKVKAVDGDNVVLTTGKGEVRIALTGVGVNDQGVFIGMTQAEFDAAVAASAGTAP